jgi:hypothetical protein
MLSVASVIHDDQKPTKIIDLTEEEKKLEPRLDKVEVP